jgi:threonylcarbamoyladenosine tRNA methylthiotransferase MtaB
VGFPGETEGEFAESSAFTAGTGFLKVHVFPYSRRSGTRAADLPNQLPKAVKEARAAAMQAAAAPSTQAFLSGMLGRTEGVLLEEPVQDKPGWMRGYTANYVEVEAPVGTEAKGKIINVSMIEVDGEIIRGAPGSM